MLHMDCLLGIPPTGRNRCFSAGLPRLFRRDTHTSSDSVQVFGLRWLTAVLTAELTALIWSLSY